MPPRDPPIRVRHLVRCETGLPEYYHAMQLAGWDIEDAYTGDDVLALLTRWKSLPPPGSRHAYSSSDYFLLGLIIERVSGRSLAQFARENLFDPLQIVPGRGAPGDGIRQTARRWSHGLKIAALAKVGTGADNEALSALAAREWGLPRQLHSLSVDGRLRPDALLEAVPHGPSQESA